MHKALTSLTTHILWSYQRGMCFCFCTENARLVVGTLHDAITDSMTYLTPAWQVAAARSIGLPWGDSYLSEHDLQTAVGLSQCLGPTAMVSRPGVVRLD